MNDAHGAATLRLTEIFYSLQGESSFTGLPTVFIRLTGCPLRCVWCDTDYAFHGGARHTLTEILDAVARHPAQHVTVTGGEPLAQPACLELLSALCDAGYAVSLETSGALDIAGVDARVSRIMDLKAPGSGEVGRNRLENLPLLTANDEVKFVIADRPDYEWSRDFLAKNPLLAVRERLFSPVDGQLSPTTLAEWILADGLNVRLQVQLHKLLWGATPGH